MPELVKMPQQGQSVESCIITRWMKKKGDAVQKGDILLSYETDKASFEIEAETSGTLLDVFFNDGDDVPVHTTIAVIGNPGENIESLRPSLSAQSSVKEVTQVAKEAPAIKADDATLRISPRARAMASQLGIDTNSIAGTGPNGRIIVRDIEGLEQQPNEIPVSKRIDPSVEFEDKKLTNVRKLIAKAMHESISSSAQLTHHMSADVRKLLALRNKVKAEMDKGSTVNITINDMVCHAVIKALKKHPEANSHFMGDQIRTFRNVHLGFAVDTPRGLMVPALQNANDFSLKGLSARLQELAAQCKKGNVNPELLSSTAASFTVSNLGNYGVEMFTPIINLPQVAILGVNTIIYRPAMLEDGIMSMIPMIGLSLTYDHRAIDGGPATLFLREIKNQIENFDEKV